MLRASELVEIQAQLRSMEDAPAILERFPDITYNTLLSIYSQKYQQQTRRSAHKHRSDERAAQYVKWYQSGEDLVAIAERINLAPCLLARIVLERVLNINKNDVTACLRDPALIPDERLRAEIENCVAVDDQYSPSVDRIRHIYGSEYEYILQEKLRNIGVGFETEEELRQRGFPKTPDVRLTVPIGVDGHVVNWIDSKAMFGDDYALSSMRDQLAAYVNRFGPGMVIFWFGHVEVEGFWGSSAGGWEDSVLFRGAFPSSVLLLAPPQSPSSSSNAPGLLSPTSSTSSLRLELDASLGLPRIDSMSSDAGRPQIE
eukprot:tig00000076_g2354.t1